MKTTAGLPIGLQHASVVEQRFKTSMITHHTSTYVRRCLENKSPNTGYRRQQPTSTIGQPASADWGTRRFAPRLCSLGLLSCFDVLYTTASEELGAAACYWLPGGQGAEQSIATKLYKSICGSGMNTYCPLTTDTPCSRNLRECLHIR